MSIGDILKPKSEKDIEQDIKITIIPIFDYVSKEQFCKEINKYANIKEDGSVLIHLIHLMAVIDHFAAIRIPNVRSDNEKMNRMFPAFHKLWNKIILFNNKLLFITINLIEEQYDLNFTIHKL